MKKRIVFLLLILFMIQTSKSLWIVTSFQINREYISSNLCINRFDAIPLCKGQCFLNSALEKEQKTNQKTVLTLEKEVLFLAPLEISVNSPLPSLLTDERKYFQYKVGLYSKHTLIFDSPPKLQA
jgi:hypothetical protein